MESKTKPLPEKEESDSENSSSSSSESEQSSSSSSGEEDELNCSDSKGKSVMKTRSIEKKSGAPLDDDDQANAQKMGLVAAWEKERKEREKEKSEDGKERSLKEAKIEARSRERYLKGKRQSKKSNSLVLWFYVGALAFFLMTLLCVMLLDFKDSPYSPHSYPVRTTSDKEVHVEVSLEDVFHERTVQFQMKRIELCEHCHGSGTIGEIEHCPVCHGTGQTISNRRFGGFQHMQVRETCRHCQGTGVHPDSMCPVCGGQGLRRHNRKFDVPIPAGADTGTVVVLEGQADEHQEAEPGNVNVILHVKKHPIFLRQELDLFIRHQVTLREALLGFSHKVKHVNKEELIFESDQVVGDDDVLTLDGKGLPGPNGQVGNLYVQIKVIYQRRRFNQQEKEELRRLLS